MNASRILAFLAILWLAADAASAAERPLRFATTTTTANSGLMEYLLPHFSAATGIDVHVIVVATGTALRLGRDGEVDLVMAHARAAEDEFVAAGHGVDRADVMINDFVVVGPPADPAGVAGSPRVDDALRRIHAGGHLFVSRGDDSGTHRRELELWRRAGVAPGIAWYREVGQGMGRALQIASELDAYTLTDRGTWLAYRGHLDLALHYEGGPGLQNPYGIIAVNPVRHSDVDHDAARRLIEWITSPAAQRLIGDYRIDGRALFLPVAGGTS